MRSSDPNVITQVMHNLDTGQRTPAVQFGGVLDALVIDTHSTNPLVVPTGMCRLLIPSYDNNTYFGPVSLPGNLDPPDGTPLLVAFVEPQVGSTESLGVRVLIILGNEPIQAPIPIGSMLDYAGGSVPSGWLLCNGQAVSRTVYNFLFAAIGTSWGVGDGVTTFNVPDFRGRVGLGIGTAASSTVYTLAETGGAETVVLTVAQLATHNHPDSGHSHTATITDPGHTHTDGSGHTHTDTGHVHTGTTGFDAPNHTHAVPSPFFGFVVSTPSASSLYPTTVFNPSMALDTTPGTAVDSPDHDHPFTTDPADANITTNHVTIATAATGITAATSSADANVVPAGTNTPHPNMQPWAAVTKIIKT